MVNKGIKFMSLFADMKRQDSITAPKDSVGGTQLLESKVYDAVIKVVYAFQSDKGAKGIKMEFLLEDGTTYKETAYISKQTGENFYVINNKQLYLPGFILVDELCAVATEAYLSSQETDTRIVKEYDFATKGEVEKEVPVLTGLLNKKVKLGIQKYEEYKTEKQANGSYELVADVVTRNAIDKVFNSDGLTTNELMDGLSEPKFLEEWETKFKGQLVNKKNDKKLAKSKAVQGTGIGSPLTNTAPKKSLFGNK